jgi:hypothetical protein
MRTFGWILALCLGTAASPALGQWSLGLRAGLMNDTNLTNARAVGIVGDHAVVATAIATQTTYFESGGSLSWGGRTATETYERYSGLNNLSLGAFAALRHKVGLGAYAPWLHAGWSSSRLGYSDKVRNGWLHQADLGAGKRLSERLSVSANYLFDLRTAATQPEAEPGVSSDAFSGRSQTFMLGAEYAADSGVLLSVSGFVRRGDIVSISKDDDRVLATAKAAAFDVVFGADRYAYRSVATSGGVKVGMDFALGPNSHIEIGVQRQLTYAAGGNNYAKTIETLAWVGNF